MTTTLIDFEDRCNRGRQCEFDAMWPYPHVHCSGCAQHIVLEGEGSNELPRGINRCTQGHVKHEYCACSESIIAHYGIPTHAVVRANDLLPVTEDIVF